MFPLKFYEALGPKIIYQKSKVCFSNTISPQMAEHISRVSGIAINEDLRRYLGMPMMKERVMKAMLHHILD